MKTKPQAGGPASIWCAMCGQWTDHGSGSCPELHPDAMAEPGPPAVAQSLKCPICGQALNAWKCGCPESVAQKRPTPRTDQWQSNWDDTREVLDAAKEMRQLERELTEANEKIAEAWKLVNAMSGQEPWERAGQWLEDNRRFAPEGAQRV